MEKTKQEYFNEFKETVKKEIKAYLPEEYRDAKVDIQEVIKNNDTVLTGLVVRKDDDVISPTIYLDEYFRVYQEGTEMESILSKIAELYVNAQNDSFDREQIIAMVTDFSAVKDRIVPRLINRNFNAKRLEGMPFKEIDSDLAVTYHILLEALEDSSASIAITKEIMAKYNISTEELHSIALKNMKVLTPASFCPISEVLIHLMGQSKEEMDGMIDFENETMFVLSSEQKTFGAAWLLDMDEMTSIKEKIGDFVILPSSVHETILVKLADLTSKENMVDELNTMVREVNATQVASDEVLSDHIYRIDWETGSIVSVEENFTVSVKEFEDIADGCESTGTKAKIKFA